MGRGLKKRTDRQNNVDFNIVLKIFQSKILFITKYFMADFVYVSSEDLLEMIQTNLISIFC